MEENQNKGLKPGDIPVVIVFILAIAVIIVGLTLDEILWVVIGIGAIFFFLGVWGFIKSKNKLKEWPILIFVLIGGMMIGIPVITMYQRTLPAEEAILTSKDIMAMMISVFPIVGVGLIIGAVGGWIYKKMFCTMPVEATCVDIQIRRTRKGKRTYRPTWNFHYNGHDYSVQGNGNNFQVPRVGDQVELLINPDKPESFSRPGDLSPLFQLIMGLTFTVMGFYALKMYLS